MFLLFFYRFFIVKSSMAFRGKYEQSHVVVKVIQWLGCIFLFSIPAMGSIVLFPQPLSVGALKWVQLIQTAAIFLLPPLCMAYLWSKQPLEWLKMKGKKLKVKGDILWAVVHQREDSGLWQTEYRLHCRQSSFSCMPLT